MRPILHSATITDNKHRHAQVTWRHAQEELRTERYQESYAEALRGVLMHILLLRAGVFCIPQRKTTALLGSQEYQGDPFTESPLWLSASRCV